ncbi:MAG: hypothetical protein HFH62_07260 [Lachnospiraceae bacterium]|nr:hypothetical protein [Lachnospiraceae bacterium]
MRIFKNTFLNFLTLAIVSCSIISSNATASQAISPSNTEAVSAEEAKEDILDDIGLTEMDLASKKKAKDISEKLSELIPAAVDDCARQRASALIETVKKNPQNFGVAIEKYANVKIEKPFIIYSAANLGKQDLIYYYPISNHGKIILMLNVMECGGSYTASISTDYASMLNKLDYQNNEDYIFYTDGENLYAENNDAAKILTDASQSDNHVLSDREKANVKIFKRLSIKNKIDAILHSYSAVTEQDEAFKKDMLQGARGFSTKKGFVVRMNTSGCLVPQYKNDETCWAASVATTLRYLNYPKYKSLTARQVADKMKIKYSKGGTNLDQQRALKKYGATYKIDHCQVSFETVQKNILAQKPVLISAYGRSYGHSLVIIGYTTYGGVKQITYYDPALNKCASVEYIKKPRTVFRFKDDIIRWFDTLRCK